MDYLFLNKELPNKEETTQTTEETEEGTEGTVEISQTIENKEEEENINVITSGSDVIQQKETIELIGEEEIPF